MARSGAEKGEEWTGGIAVLEGAGARGNDHTIASRSSTHGLDVDFRVDAVPRKLARAANERPRKATPVRKPTPRKKR